ncbi:MAG: patatin [Deltaproteobacteria bacterium HGW-Deltaproteobacteria-19]|jgi:NTE family protein|nr:MAG: patatin [Deltaproteobacteria bacterium HGW-Deltaproteobacteria-19]
MELSELHIRRRRPRLWYLSHNWTLPPGNIFRQPLTCLSVLLVLAVLAGCTAQYPLNPVLGPRQTVAPQHRGVVEKDDPLFLVLAFSGGGTRAASLSYGVLEALDRIEIPGKGGPDRHTLLDEVNLITSVSGGSFTAATYGLRGRDMFRDYRERFLLVDHQSSMLAGFLNPLNWARLWSPRFGRSDMAQEYYDQILFDGATLGDIPKRDRPNIMILATDILNGQVFPFSTLQFSLICSDWKRFPVSRAVAASAAFPGAFTPVILKNYAGDCGWKPPEWMTQALEKPDPSSRGYHMAKSMATYLDRDDKPYIHLLDGGISDNLGLRSILEYLAVRGGIIDSLKEQGYTKVRRMTIIIVNAENREQPRWRLLDEVPGLGAILGASSAIMINRYNFETVDLLRRYVRDWSDELRAAGMPPIEFYIIEVGFDFLRDAAEREYFQAIPTSLYLPEVEVDRLRSVAERLLLSSGPFRKMVKDLGGRLPGDPPAEKVDGYTGEPKTVASPPSQPLQPLPAATKAEPGK